MSSSSADVKRYKREFGFSEKKSLGQNFLIDQNVIWDIVDAAGVGPEDLVIEIGPGMGALTTEIAERAAQVIAIEIDQGLLPILERTLAGYDNVRIVNEDVLKVDINGLIEEATRNLKSYDRNGSEILGDCIDADESDGQTGSVRAETGLQAFKHVRIIGNLPYYITTPIIMKLLEDAVSCDSITVMMQKEVADRIRSGPGSKAYGAISVGVQFYCSVDSVLKVPSSSFSPAPKVDSAVLTLRPFKKFQAADADPVTAEPDCGSYGPEASNSPGRSSENSDGQRENCSRVQVADRRIFFECVKKSFSQRRKTLQNSLTGVCSLDKNAVTQILLSCSIEPGRRAETLSIEEFAALADAVAAALAE